MDLYIYLSFCTRLISFSINVLGVHPCCSLIGFPSFLRLCKIQSYVYTTCIYPLIYCGNLGCFPLLAIDNYAVMNMDVQMSLQDPALSSLYIYPEVRLLDHMVILFFNFLRKLHISSTWQAIVFHNGYPICIPNNAQGF